jgi:hypothetical protein
MHSGGEQHQLLGFRRNDFDCIRAVIYNQRFHNGIPVFFFAAYMIEVISKEPLIKSSNRTAHASNGI